MIETHPFGEFVPKNSRYLILGSFTGKSVGENSYDWFYGAKRNQFWSILESVYGLPLKDKKEKIELFRKLKIAIGDIIYQCERKKGNNLDTNLVNIIYNAKGISTVLKRNKIYKIFFTSRFVEHKFKSNFKNILEKYPNIKLITLPSPSPRYAAVTKMEKIKKYKEILPKLK